jgi:inosine/xanthosine triphosphate pyrophosphatase family protein
MLAMGNAAETKEAETGRMSHRIKSLAKLKRNTESMGL